MQMPRVWCFTHFDSHNTVNNHRTGIILQEQNIASFTKDQDWLALCSGPAQWPWVGGWFTGWPTLGLAAGVAGLVLAVVPGEKGGSGQSVWLWSIALAAVVCALWAGPLGLDVPLWPTRATR